MYDMMVTFKLTPLEFANSLPRRLCNLVEQKWKHYILIEREIRETKLATVAPDFTPQQIKDAIEEYKGKFFTKYQAFKVLKGKINEVEKQSTSIWAVVYGKGVPSTPEIREPLEKHVDTPPSTRKGKSIKRTLAEAKTKQQIKPIDEVTIEDASDEEELVKNKNPLTDEDIKRLTPAHDSTLSTAPILIQVDASPIVNPTSNKC